MTLVLNVNGWTSSPRATIIIELSNHHKDKAKRKKCVRKPNHGQQRQA